MSGAPDATEFSQRLGRELRALRTAAGLTQEEAALASGLTWRHIQRIEGGKTNPTVSALACLAAAYGHRLEFRFTPS